MKLLLFKFCTLLVFITAFAQEKTVFNKIISTETIDKLELELENIPLEISESPDDKIHIDFKINFINYSKQEIDSVVNNMFFEKSIEEKTLTLNIKSKIEVSKSQYNVKFFNSEALNKYLKKYAKSFLDKNTPRSKEEVLQNRNNSIGALQEYFNARKKLVLKNKDSKYREANFYIYIPKRLKDYLKLDADKCRLNFDFESLKNCDLFVNGGNFTTKKIENTKFTRYNGVCLIENVVNSELDIKSSVRNTFGEITNSTIDSDDSNIEIGELGENIKIKDFYSKIHLYNFSSSFKTFNFTGEYSTIYFFEPKNDYEMSCFGHDTTFYFNGKDPVISQLSKTGEKSKMMTRDRKNNKPFSGVITFDIVHSKFYYPTELKTNKN